MFFHFGGLPSKTYNPGLSYCASCIEAHGPHQMPKEPSRYVQPLRKILRFKIFLSRPLAARGSTNEDRATTSNFRQKRHLQTNRKWKYGEPHRRTRSHRFPIRPNTIYGPIGHRLDAGNYFRFRRDRKY